MFRIMTVVLSLVICGLLVVGCGNDTDGDESGGSSANLAVRMSDCGVVVDGAAHNPPDARLGIGGRIIDGLTGEYVAFQPDDPEMGPVLVKSLAARATDRIGAKRFVARAAGVSQAAVLFKAGDGCEVVTADGGSGVLGTIVLADGRVLTELLLSNGFLQMDGSTRHCSASLVENCYHALAEAAPDPTPTPAAVSPAPQQPGATPAPSTGQVSGSVINHFLWKPRSDRDGTLAILFNPTASRVTVNGGDLHNSGPSNGRASTFRGGHSGCSYGRAVIQAWDTRGRLLQWPGGQSSYVIANGCNRVEF